MCEHRKYYEGLYTGGGTVSVPGRGTTARCVNNVSIMRVYIQGMVL